MTSKIIRRADGYLRDQERSVGVPLSLPQGESPGRTAAQRHADVIPGAHAARNSSAKPPRRNHRACQPNQQLPPPLHRGIIPIIGAIPRSSPLRRRRHGARTRLRASHATGGLS